MRAIIPSRAFNIILKSNPNATNKKYKEFSNAFQRKYDNKKDNKIEENVIVFGLIPNFLNNNTELMKMISNISEASINDGGSGAFYIFLKKK